VFLGQALRAATAEEVANGFRENRDSISAPTALITACRDDKDAELRFVVVRLFYYWHNRAVVRSGLYWTIADKALDVPADSAVEVELVPGKQNGQCLTIRRVRPGTLCGFRDNPHSTTSSVAGALSGLGRYGSASIYCPELESEGWTKAVIGPYGAFAWMKGPGSSATPIAAGERPESSSSAEHKPSLTGSRETPDYVSCVVKGERRSFVPITECDP
jgi:hypothetical protein